VPEKPEREIRTAWVKGKSCERALTHAGIRSKGKKTPEKKNIGVITSSV